MKFFTARTLPIFEQCFGQNKEFFNSLLAMSQMRSVYSPSIFAANPLASIAIKKDRYMA